MIENTLLTEVKHDALEKSRGAEQGEKFFELIRFMCELNKLSRKDGLLAVAEAEIPSEIALSDEICEARNIFAETASTEGLAKKLTDQYWANDFQGKNALLYYMIILSFVNLESKKSHEFEQLLLSCLNAESAETYLKNKSAL